MNSNEDLAVTQEIVSYFYFENLQVQRKSSRGTERVLNQGQTSSSMQHHVSVHKHPSGYYLQLDLRNKGEDYDIISQLIEC